MWGILEYDDEVPQMLHQHGVTAHVHLIKQDVYKLVAIKVTGN